MRKKDTTISEEKNCLEELLSVEMKNVEVNPFSPKPTGLDLLDYSIGKYIEDSDKNIIYKTGVNQGKITLIIGKSGIGKSSFANKIAKNLVHNTPGSSIRCYDFERALDPNRITMLTDYESSPENENVLGFYKDEDKFVPKYFLYNFDISAESLLKDVILHGKAKCEFVEKGKIKKENLPTTVYIVDTVSVVASENKYGSEEIGSNMEGAQTAKDVTLIIKKLVGSGILLKSNITLILVNHISTKINANPFARQTSDLNFLKQDETLPGGSAQWKYADSLFKLVASTKYDYEKTGIRGFKVICDIVKSRATHAGNSCIFTYDQYKGFLNEYSNLEWLKDADLLKGSGHGYYFGDNSDQKFKTSDFLELIETNEDFKNKFNAYVKSELEVALKNRVDGNLYNKKINSDEIDNSEPEIDEDLEKML